MANDDDASYIVQHGSFVGRKIRVHLSAADLAALTGDGHVTVKDYLAIGEPTPEGHISEIKIER